MNILHNECENVKKILSDDDEAFIRIPDLPNNSTFGKVVTKDILT